MKYVALTLRAAVAVMALSAGTTFAVLEWAPERLPQGVPGQRGEAGEPGPKGPRGPRGQAATLDPAGASIEDGETTDRLADLERAAKDDERLAKENLRAECSQLQRDSNFGPVGPPRPPTDLEQQARDRYYSLNCSQQ